MSCCNNCCCHIPTLTATSFSATGSVTTIVVGPFAGAVEKCCGFFNICIPFCLPQSEAGNTVSLSTGGTVYPMQDRTGNSLRVGQILYGGKCGCPSNSQRKFIHARLLADPSHVQVLDCLPTGCAVPDSPATPAS